MPVLNEVDSTNVPVLNEVDSTNVPVLNEVDSTNVPVLNDADKTNENTSEIDIAACERMGIRLRTLSYGWTGKTHSYIGFHHW